MICMMTVAKWIDERRIRLGDVDPTGRAWLDAIAGFVQDAAADHSDHNGYAGTTWVVRRLQLRCTLLPRHRDVMTVSTWCSGVGPRWAERTTTLAVSGVVGVEAVAVWVHVDPSTGVPAALPAGFHDVYGSTITNSKVSVRLQHGDAPDTALDGVERFAWQVRRADLDLLGHVNNARYWAAVEEVLAARSMAPEPLVAAIEFRRGLDHELASVVHLARADGGADMWVLDARDQTAASVRLSPI